MQISSREYRFLHHDIGGPLRTAGGYLKLVLQKEDQVKSIGLRRHLESAHQHYTELSRLHGDLSEMALRAQMMRGNEAGPQDEPEAWRANLDSFFKLTKRMHADVQAAYRIHARRPGRDESLKEFMKNIRDASRQAHRFVTSMEGRQTKRFSLKKLVAESLPILAASRLEITTRLPPATVMITGNSVALQRILLNMALNASRRGNATKLDLHARTEGNKLMLHITNNGKPIPAEEHETIFDEGHSSAGSSGLGLTLSREAALGHGGDLRLVESVPGRTTFELELPLIRRKKRP